MLWLTRRCNPLALMLTLSLHHWLMLGGLGLYIVNMQWSTTSEAFLTIFTFGLLPLNISRNLNLKVTSHGTETTSLHIKPCSYHRRYRTSLSLYVDVNKPLSKPLTLLLRSYVWVNRLEGYCRNILLIARKKKKDYKTEYFLYGSKFSGRKSLTFRNHNVKRTQRKEKFNIVPSQCQDNVSMVNRS